MDLERALLKGLATGITVVLVSGLVFLLGKLGGGGMKVGPGEIVLRHGGFLRGTALLGLLLPFGFLALLIVTLVSGSPADGPVIVSLVLGGLGLLFGMLDGYLLAESFGRRIVLTDEGIASFGWLGPAGTLKWSEVDKVANKVGAGKFIVSGGNTKIRLNHYLAGLDKFAEECKKRLAPEVYGKAFEKPLNRPFM